MWGEKLCLLRYVVKLLPVPFLPLGEKYLYWPLGLGFPRVVKRV